MNSVLRRGTPLIFLKNTYTFLGRSLVFKADPISMVPLVASSQYNFDDKFSLGLNLGYAVVINENKKGGFLYQPKVGVRISEKHDVNAFYTGVAV
ncbi:hypothetical protein [Soonwooa sp.]|uniref:hypothetical protein n=1 Tax=Soonwooa sp. TaxID=1938592 RepID=UPI0028AF990A|nr:hypothetical protein [Soonwooa sp.]